MNADLVYHEIGLKLWSIMPKESVKIFFSLAIHDGWNMGMITWELSNGYIETFSFGNRPYQLELEIEDLLISLKKESQFSHSDWNQCRFTLSDNMSFDIQFAYIPEDDYWDGLYLKGISDLSEEEMSEYHIPKELWEERVRAKSK